MHRQILPSPVALAAVLALVLGFSLAGGAAARAQGNGATVVQTPDETCFLETSPGVFEPFSCDNIDVYTPNGKIRTHASGETAPPADGAADVTHEYATFPVCSSTVSASGKTRFTCHLD
jgi:hypothetical protein